MKKGFTLVELIGVITLLGLLAILVTPPIINQIKNSKGRIDEVTERLIYSTADLYIDTRKSNFPKINDNTYCITINDLIDSGKLNEQMLEDREIDLDSYVKVDVLNKQYKYSLSNSCEVNILYIDTTLNGADPVVKTGMIPVNIAADGTVTKADTTIEWYDYANKEWANVVTVTEVSRANYMSASAGTTIQEADILTYLVWIPRYKYKLWYTDTENMFSSTDSTKVHSIEITFENKDTPKSEGSTNGTYLTHPAFTFGTEELNGIWVGKFETGYAGATTYSEAQKNVENSAQVIIKPNTYSWRSITVSNAFNTVKGMNGANNVFGLDGASDTHMMKNTEWGAVAYLSHSVYGKDGQVYINNNSKYTTGCGGATATGGRNSNCLNAYGSKSDNVYNQSTTGNISGVFDMSGGAFEYVMGYTTGTSTEYGSSSGFATNYVIEDKYVDRYNTPSNDRDYTKRILGDATGEMGPFSNYNMEDSYKGSWYSDISNVLNNSNPWFLRGGKYEIESYAGVFFFSCNSGRADSDFSFRVSVA